MDYRKVYNAVLDNLDNMYVEMHMSLAVARGQWFDRADVPKDQIEKLIEPLKHYAPQSYKRAREALDAE